MKFRDFRASLDADLPEYDPQISSGVDRFWSAMAEVRSVTDSETFRYSVLSKLAKILLILPHSNADPERLFSMVRKIETDQRKQLDPSTVCDLLSVKINNDNPCYSNQPLMTPTMLISAKSATRRSLSSSAEESLTE